MANKQRKHTGAREVLYSGRVFSVQRHHVKDASGRASAKDVVHHPGSAVILPLLKSRGVVLIRQFRIAINTEVWELPAGTRNPKETFLQTARRELTEETGFRAKRWRKLVEYFPSPGFLNERMAIFAAQGLTAGEAAPEDDEEISVESMSIARAVQMIGTGQICDSKTIIGILFWDKFGKNFK